MLYNLPARQLTVSHHFLRSDLYLLRSTSKLRSLIAVPPRMRRDPFGSLSHVSLQRHIAFRHTFRRVSLPKRIRLIQFDMTLYLYGKFGRLPPLAAIVVRPSVAVTAAACCWGHLFPHKHTARGDNALGRNFVRRVFIIHFHHVNRMSFVCLTSAPCRLMRY